MSECVCPCSGPDLGCLSKSEGMNVGESVVVLVVGVGVLHLTVFGFL